MEYAGSIQHKSYKFALEIIQAYKHLVRDKEFILSKQLLRSGTSIGANIQESQGGHTYKDFTNKIQIAYKEALETRYWINLLKDSFILDEIIAISLLEKCEELLRIMNAIQKTIKSKSK